jgi:hypothetical protein
MSRKRFDAMPCSIARALDVVGDWWTLLIIREAFLGVRRFADFRDHLGIARNILPIGCESWSPRTSSRSSRRRARSAATTTGLTEKGRDLWRS